jgi:hypothetical protein
VERTAAIFRVKVEAKQSTNKKRGSSRALMQVSSLLIACLLLENGGGKFYRNIGDVPDYTASHTRS